MHYKVIDMRVRRNSYSRDYSGNYCRPIFYTVEGRAAEVPGFISTTTRKGMDTKEEFLYRVMKEGRLVIGITGKNQAVPLERRKEAVENLTCETH